MANFDFIDLWRKNNSNPGHSSFPLDKKQVIDFPCSQIQPHLFIPTIPNEHHKVNLSGLLRSETLNTAAFVSGSFHTNLYFVPLSQLWHRANDFFSQKSDKHSSTLNDSKHMPVIRLTDLLRFIRGVHFHHIEVPNGYVDMFGYPWSVGAVRLLQLLKYGNYRWIIAENDDNTPKYSDDNFDHYCKNIDNDGINGREPKPRYVNIWRAASYQHIFYDVYRNKYYDEKPWYQSEIASDESRQCQYIDTFNFDDIVCSDLEHSIIPISLNEHISSELEAKARARIMNLFSMHYTQYKRDIFTSAMPATQFGAVSSISFDDINIKNERHPSGATANAQVLGEGYTKPAGTLYFSNQNNDKWSIANAFNVLTFRKAELLQRWKQNALRAGNQVDDNFRSHFGVSPYYEDDNNVKFLGSFSTPLNVNPITANAATGADINGNVGDLAAIGVGSTHGDTIEFECKDFGYIVAVTSFLPDVYYNANGIDMDNTFAEPFDYPYPEFENTGLEPILLGQQSVEQPWNVGLGFGFVPPFSTYKTQIDEVFGEFSDVEPSWFENSQQHPVPSEFAKDLGSLRAWVLTRHEDILVQDTDGNVTNRRKLSSLYVDPAVVNPIFGIEYDGSQRTYPINLALSWDWRAIRPLSVLGIPQF